MSGYDDPRFLQQKIEGLERELKDLRAVSLPFLTHQRGALPGSMRSVSIGDVGQKSSMWINMVGNQPGQAPYMAVTDANGVVRFEMGNLAANGASPAQFGWRVNDASGNPIADSLGVVASKVIQSLGIADTGGTQSFSSTSFATPTNGTVSFTVTGSRAVSLYIPFVGTGNVTTNNGNVGFLRGNYDSGTVTSGNENFGVLSNFAQSSSGWLFVPSAAPGSHTAKLEAAVNATPQTFQLIEGAIQVFQLGS